MLVAPSVFDRASLHLEEEMSAAARRVLFFARHHEGRTHRVLVTLAAEPAALSDADTAQRRVREAAAVVRVLEIGLERFGRIIGAEPKVLVDAVWIDDLPRVHFRVRIPDRF